MAKYTTEVRSICEEVSGFGKSGGYADVKEIITAAIPKIFNFDFPIFDESYRKPLEFGILRHFYTREIGFETYGLWKLKLDTKLNEIMPYYNQWYKSTLLDFNPLFNVDVTETHDFGRNVKQNDKTSRTEDMHREEDYNNHQERDSTGYNLYSQTPQGGLEGVDTGEYLTEATKVTDNGTVTDDNTGTVDSTTGTDSTLDSTINTTEDYVNHIVGKNSGESFSEMVIKFRESFVNVDKMIMEELEVLFMGVW